MAFIREYAAMSGDPGFSLKRALKVPKGLRKFRPSGLAKVALGGAALLATGGLGGIVGGVGSLLGGAERAAVGGIKAIGGRLVHGAAPAAAAGASAIQSTIMQIASAYGIDADTFAQAAINAGIIDSSDWTGGEAYGDLDSYGDPAARRSPRQRSARGGGRAKESAGSSGASKARALADLASQLAGSGALGPMAAASAQATAAGRSLAGGAHGAHAHRRINPANVHALRRAMRRVIGFEKLAVRATHQLRQMVTKSHTIGVTHHRAKRRK